MIPSTVLHIPHASTFIPEDVRMTLCLGEEELSQELLAMTDRYTDELFALPASVATSLCFPVSRLVVDPERFPNDADEPMARVGMGVVYERTSRGKVLRPVPSEGKRNDLLARFYRPHHAKLDEIATAVLAQHDRCLVVDCHSFPAMPLPYELDQRPERADICVGSDAFHTSGALRGAAARFFESRGLTVEIDRPFAGTLVPARYYRCEPRVSSVMVEVNRRLYMDERTGERSSRFADVCKMVQDGVRAIILSVGGV